MTRNELGMVELSENEAIKLGADLTCIRICKELRKLAKLDRLYLDGVVHCSELNADLLQYIEYCGGISSQIF